MTAPPPRVVIVIVTHNSAGEVATCLDSARATARRVPLETVVVDNASSDETLEIVRRHAPEIRLHASDRNAGFAAGCNLGIGATSSELILLLNPDACLHPDTLPDLVAYLDAHSQVGIVGPALETPDGELQRDLSATGLFPSFPQALFEYTPLGRWFPKSRWVRGYRLAGFDRRGNHRVAMVQGACFLVRREVLRQVGLLDEDFFLYFEETDLCKRAAAAGWETHYVGTTTATHIGARSNVDQTPSADEFIRSLYRFHRKHYGFIEAGLLWLLLAPCHLLETLRLALASRRHPLDRTLQRDLRTIARRSAAHLQILAPRRQAS